MADQGAVAAPDVVTPTAAAAPSAAAPAEPAAEPVVANPEVAAEAPIAAAEKPAASENSLAEQLRALEAGERMLAEQREREQRALIAAQMQPDAPRQEPPKFNERDLAFLGARPGIDRDPRLAATVHHLEALGLRWGTDRFYTALDSIFPVEDFRPADKLPESPESKPMSRNTPAIKFAREIDPNERRMREQTPADEDAARRIRGDASVPVVVSAPVSREAGYDLSGARIAPSASSVRLSREQREIARASGMSDVDYARQLLKMNQMKRAGLIQDGGG